MHQFTCCVKEAELVAFAAHRDGGDIVVKNCSRTKNSLAFYEIASPTIKVCCLKSTTNFFRFSYIMRKKKQYFIERKITSVRI